MPTRYAIYFTPPAGPLAETAAHWLGWDPAAGEARAHPPMPDLPQPVEALTATPRKYGFHGTLKAPFRLANGQSEAALRAAITAYAASRAPAMLNGLKVARLGRFLALIPDGDATPLSDLAADIVRAFEPFRAPLTEADIARRRKSGLTPEQDALMLKWGYPYVMDEFRFHMTLTGALDPETLDAVQPAIEAHFEPVLTRPFPIDAITLSAEGEDGRFRTVQRLPLTG